MTLTKPDMQRVDAIVGSVRAQMSIARDHGRQVHQVLIGHEDWKLIKRTQATNRMVLMPARRFGKTAGVTKSGEFDQWMGLEVCTLLMAETVMVI